MSKAHVQNNKFTSYDELPLFLRVSDVQEILAIGRNSAYDIISKGQLPSIRCGNLIRIPKTALLPYIGSATIES